MGFSDFMGKISDPFSQWGINPSSYEKQLSKLGKAGWSSPEIQRMLPHSLQTGMVGDILQSGVQGIGQMIQNPGQLGSNVSGAIGQRLAGQSENMAQQFRGALSNQSGMAARSNLPVGMKNALASALDVAQMRGQRDLRRNALQDSDQLRRQDLSGTYDLLNIINSIVGARMGVATNATQAAAGMKAQGQASLMSAGGAVASFFGSASRFKENFKGVDKDKVLDAVKEMPVYEWSYKGEGTRHVGPMAEEFKEAFGLGSSPDIIEIVDAFGTMMVSLQALAQKVEQLEAASREMG